MEQTFGKSMQRLHTWVGAVLGCLLFVIFWMGTLSVFDKEIDRWMMPGTRLTQSTRSISLDRVAQMAASAVPANASEWRVDLPTGRVPVMRFSYRDGQNKTTLRQLDPATGQWIPEQGTRGATGFIYPFHYSLQLKWMELGRWLVGFAAMALLVLLVSGVIIHKKIWTAFFTFRPKARFQRSSLDLHHVTGVLGLPFYFMMALSGLIIFMAVYFPQAYMGVYGNGAYGNDDRAKKAFTAEAQGRFRRPEAHRPGALASLDAMAAQAEREWAGGRPYFVRVWNPGDAQSYVEMRRSYARDITMNLDQIYFDAGTGKILQRFRAAPMMSAQRFFVGLHHVQFEHWILRWLYFFAGLSGCVMIGTGLLFWIEARRTRHAKQGLSGARAVQALTTGCVSGTLLATLAFFAANRLLPAGAHFAGLQRESMEISAFWLMWATGFLQAWMRPSTAWCEQAWAVCVMALVCVLLNAATTGDHLIRAVSSGMWAVAGMDSMLLVLALLSAGTGRRLASNVEHKSATWESPTSATSG